MGEKPKVVLKEKNIEDIIENIRNEFGSWEQVSRKSSVGDNIEIEYLLLPGNRVEKKTLIVKKNNTINLKKGKINIDLNNREKEEIIELETKEQTEIGEKVKNIKVIKIL